MSDEKQQVESSAEAWQEVGRQFKLLGESLSSALHTAWESEATQQSLRELQTGIHSAVEAVNKVAAKAAKPATPPPPLTHEVEHFLRVTRQAVAQAGDEDRPKLIAILEGVTAELQDLVTVLKTPPPPPPEAPAD